MAMLSNAPVSPESLDTISSKAESAGARLQNTLTRLRTIADQLGGAAPTEKSDGTSLIQPRAIIYSLSDLHAIINRIEEELARIERVV